MYPHYPTDNPNRYEFLTDNGIPYIVEFSDASGYFDPISSIQNAVEDISFNPVGNKNGLDDRIAPTISDIIKQRCRANNTAVVFICDQSGDRSRAKLFKSWNGMFNDGGFHFQPAIIEHPTGRLYTGIIVDSTNQNAQTYLNEFSRAMQAIEAKFN